MNHTHFGITLAAVLTLIGVSAKADTFGTGGNMFTIDFVTIGDPGNGDDLGAGGGIYSSVYGGVPYEYRMGVTEVPQDWITKATNLGLMNVPAGAWAGNQPAASINWYQAARFVNWMNISTGHQAAYNLDPANASGSLTLWSSVDAWQAGGENLYRHKDAYYFLPSEDEWYKTAFHKNDGVTANYWDYATANNSIPSVVNSGTDGGTAVYDLFNGGVGFPAAVDNDGGLSSYGTRGQNGNVWEWQESALDGTNDDPSETRGFRGGYWGSSELDLRSSIRGNNDPSVGSIRLGFRVASIPEPSSALLLLGSGGMLLLKRHSGARF